MPVLGSDGVSLSFTIGTPPATPTTVRYTANNAFPQCALYNGEGLPAFPFEMDVESKQI